MATKQDCPHTQTVWVGWISGGYVQGWKCLACGTILVPSDEEE